jgi:SET family sugar efflux transporter-like MFS transporter
MSSRFRPGIRSFLDQPNFTGLLGSTFALGIAFSFVSPFLSKWGTEEIGLSPTHFSFFMTAVLVSSILLGTVLARLSDTHLSRKWMLVLGSGGGVLGYAGYALVRDVGVLLLIGCTLIAVATTCFAQLFAHAREYYQEGRSGRRSSSFTLSVIRVCFSFSWTLGPALGSFVLLAGGFRSLYLTAAALYLVFLVGVLRFVPHVNQRTVANSRPALDSIWQTLARPQVFRAFLAFSAAFAAHSVNMMNLPLATTRTLGGTESDFGIIFGIGPLVEIPLMLYFGHLAGKGWQLRLLQIGFLITALYFTGLWLASAPWQVYLLQILNGASFAILTNVAILYFQDLLPGQAGLASTIFANTQTFGSLLGILLFGLIVDAFGYQSAFLVCALTTSAGLLLMLLQRPATASIP